MSTFDENKVARDSSGKFANQFHSESESTLEGGEEDVYAHLERDFESFVKDPRNRPEIYLDYRDELSPDDVENIFEGVDSVDKYGEVTTCNVGQETEQSLREQAYDEGTRAVGAFLREKIAADPSLIQKLDLPYESPDDLESDDLDLGQSAVSHGDDALDELRMQAMDYVDFEAAVQQMARQTPGEFVSVELARYEGQYISGLASDSDDKKRAWIEKVLKDNGITVTAADTEALEDLAANGPYDYQDGVTCEVFWRASVADYVPTSDDSTTKVAFERPCILVTDRTQGTGYEAELSTPYTMAVHCGPDGADGSKRVLLDRANGPYGWDETCGLIPSAYSQGIETTHTTTTKDAA